MGGLLVEGRSKILVKAMTVFLIIILPLYILSLLITIHGRNDVRREVAESVKSKISFSVRNLEREFEAIISAQSRLIGDPDLKFLLTDQAHSQRYETAKAMNALRVKLSDIKDRSKYVLSASLYIPAVGKKITDKVIVDMDKQEFDVIKDLTLVDSALANMHNGRIYINITPDFKDLKIHEHVNPSYIISVEISSQELKKIIDAFNLYKNGGSILLGDDYGLNIVNGVSNEMLAQLKYFMRKNPVKSDKASIGKIRIQSRRYILCYQSSKLLNTTSLVYIPEERLSTVIERYDRWIWLVSGLTIITVAMFSLWMRMVIARPIGKLVDAFKRVEKGDLNIKLEYNTKDEFKYLFGRFNEMCGRLKTLIEEVYEEKLHARNAELKQLQYQINPHFLYNSFFVIHQLARLGDTEKVASFTHHLGKFYEFITRSEVGEVSLEEEVNHAKDYIQIQSYTFMGRVKVEFGEIPDECQSIKVPRLILQPIIENAYKHGLKDAIEEGRLRVSMKKDGGDLYIAVEDSGDSIDIDSQGGSLDELISRATTMLESSGSNIEGTGLINVHRRLQIKFGKENGLILTKSELGGFCVRMKIPLK